MTDCMNHLTYINYNMSHTSHPNNLFIRTHYSECMLWSTTEANLKSITSKAIKKHQLSGQSPLWFRVTRVSSLVWQRKDTLPWSPSPKHWESPRAWAWSHAGGFAETKPHPSAQSTGQTQHKQSSSAITYPSRTHAPHQWLTAGCLHREAHKHTLNISRHIHPT